MPSIISATTTTGLVSSADTSGSLQLATNNGTAAVTIDTSQNVGIGTTSPTATLDVTHSNGGSARIRGVSTDGARLQFFNNAATANGFFVGQGFSTGTDNVAYLSNQANADMIFRTNSAERMRIMSDGCLNIGKTDNATGRLDIGGQANGVATNVARFGNIAGLNNGPIVLVDASNNWLINQASGSIRVGSTIAVGGATALYGVGGITFPATQSASSDANTLDDYEEGTWTPAPTFGSGNTGLTTSVTQGSYVKIGRMVMVQGRVVFTNRGSSTGSFFVRGLPFTCAQADGDANNRFYSGANIGYLDFVATGSVWASAQTPTIDTGTTYILFRYVNTSNGRYNDHTQASLTNSTDIIFQAFYQTST